MPDGAAKPHVLCINDAPEILALYRELLEDEGFRVSTQSVVARNLDEIKRLRPDCVILDYMWADDDAGWTMLEMLRMSRQTKEIPVVLCTGAVRQVEALQSHLAEMRVRVVLKPFDIDHLIGVVNAALGRP